MSFFKTRPWRLSSCSNDGSVKKGIEEKKYFFDEIVVGDWLHIEEMSRDHFWMRIGNSSFDLFKLKDGSYKFRSQETDQDIK